MLFNGGCEYFGHPTDRRLLPPFRIKLAFKEFLLLGKNVVTLP
jgi:hypothetical protein